MNSGSRSLPYRYYIGAGMKCQQKNSVKRNKKVIDIPLYGAYNETTRFSCRGIKKDAAGSCREVRVFPVFSKRGEKNGGWTRIREGKRPQEAV